MKKFILLATIVAGCSHPAPQAPEPEPECVYISDLDEIYAFRCTLDGKTYLCIKTLTGYGYECWNMSDPIEVEVGDHPAK